MSSTRPSIRRLDQPTAGITKAPEPLPVMVTLRWADGRSQDLPGIARAWTAAAVLVEWRWSERAPGSATGLGARARRPPGRHAGEGPASRKVSRAVGPAIEAVGSEESRVESRTVNLQFVGCARSAEAFDQPGESAVGSLAASS